MCAVTPPPPSLPSSFLLSSNTKQSFKLHTCTSVERGKREKGKERGGERGREGEGEGGEGERGRERERERERRERVLMAVI